MAVKSNAGRTVLYVYSRPDAVPPIKFADANSVDKFSFSIMAKVLDTTVADTLIVYTGTDGSQISIDMNGTQWTYSRWDGPVVVETFPLRSVKVGVWVAFCFARNGYNTQLRSGEEDPDFPLEAINLTLHFDQNAPYDFTFDHIAVVTRSNIAICNFRYWNSFLGDALGGDVNDQVNRWDTGGTHPAHWASPLRTPGDISNIANPYTSPSWNRGHDFDAISPSAGTFVLEFPEPRYLENKPCPTWVYPLTTDFVTFNPGNTPLVQTNYKSTIFWKFQDRGTIPVVATFISITYLAFPFKTDTGPGPSSSFPLFINELGTELVTDLNDPTNRFEQDSGVTIPNTMTSVNMYLWQFGGQFTWVPAVPQQPAGTGNLGYPYLYIIYTGRPAGSPSLPALDLAGLFKVDKGGKSVDRYNRGIEMKIPDPTIRTAFVGE